MKTRVLIVGLDGADPRLIARWRDSLPTLTKLRSEGVWGNLNSTTPAVTGPAWLSFASGMNPGKHGYHYWERHIPGTYEFDPLSSRAVHKRALWELLSDAGYRVGLVNVPATFPPSKVNGIIVAGLGVPGAGSSYTYPDSLKAELESRFGYRAPEAPDYAVLDADSKLGILQHNVQVQLTVCQQLLREQDFDFFMVVFGATDLAQHFFWADMDSGHPLHGRRSYDPRCARAILETYVRVDAAVATLIESVGSEANVFVVSDHGFGPQYSILSLNRWLVDHGYLHIRGYKPTLLGTIGRVSQLTDFVGLDHEAMCKIASKLLSLGLRNTRLGSLLTLMALNYRSQFGGLVVDWPASQAYSVGQDAIYLNIKGREPEGAIDPLDVETVIAKLVDRLLDTRHPQTGEPLVLDVLRQEQVYSGHNLVCMPDLLLSLRDGYQTRPHLTRELVVPPECERTGCHRQQGIFIGWGPDIRGDCFYLDADIMDVAPTVSHLMGLPISKSIDGHVLQDIFCQDSHANRPVEYDDVEGDEKYLNSGLSIEEGSLLKEHLRGLGYL